MTDPKSPPPEPPPPKPEPPRPICKPPDAPITEKKSIDLDPKREDKSK